MFRVNQSTWFTSSIKTSSTTAPGIKASNLKEINAFQFVQVLSGNINGCSHLPGAAVCFVE